MNRTSFTVLLAVAALSGPGGLAHAQEPADPSAQDPAEAAAFATLQAEARRELSIVIFDVCVSVVGGTEVTRTTGYDALGRPPLVDGSFATSAGITVTPSSPCQFGLPWSQDPSLLDYSPFTDQRDPQELADWNHAPFRAGEDSVQLLSDDARLGIRISRFYDGGEVFAYSARPEDVAEYYANVWSAAFASSGTAAVNAFNGCSSFLFGGPSDQMPARDIAFYGNFGNTSAGVRGHIDASIWPVDKGCEVYVNGTGLRHSISTALTEADSGWTQDTKTSWSAPNGGRIDLTINGPYLTYAVRPDDFADHDWNDGGSWQSVSKENVETDWAFQCWPGQDGFRSNCEAVKFSRGWRMAISTGDDQFFLTLKPMQCFQMPRLRNWWREEVGYSRAEVESSIKQALPDLLAQATARCPAASAEPPDLGVIPPILQKLFPISVPNALGGVDENMAIVR